MSDWLVQLTDADTPAARDQGARAVQGIGTNAIPTLVQMLREEEPRYWSEYLAWRHGWYHPLGWHFWEPPDNLGRARDGFDALGASAAPAVPELVKILNENPSRRCQHQVVAILGDIGPPAKAAVPTLLRLAANRTNLEHSVIFHALGNIHAEPQLVVPVLAEVISNSPRDRFEAASALGKFGASARPAAPVLAALLADPSLPPGRPGFVSDRENIEGALRSIAPDTYARVVTNQAPASGP